MVLGHLRRIRAYTAVAVFGLGMSLVVGSLVLIAEGSVWPEYLVFMIGLAMFPVSFRIAWPGP